MLLTRKLHYLPIINSDTVSRTPNSSISSQIKFKKENKEKLISSVFFISLVPNTVTLCQIDMDLKQNHKYLRIVMRKKSINLVLVQTAVTLTDVRDCSCSPIVKTYFCSSTPSSFLSITIELEKCYFLFCFVVTNTVSTKNSFMYIQRVILFCSFPYRQLSSVLYIMLNVNQQKKWKIEKKNKSSREKLISCLLVYIWHTTPKTASKSTTIWHKHSVEYMRAK